MTVDLEEAGAYIEKLRERIAALQAKDVLMSATITKLDAENARLRAALGFVADVATLTTDGSWLLSAADFESVVAALAGKP